MEEISIFIYLYLSSGAIKYGEFKGLTKIWLKKFIFKELLCFIYILKKKIRNRTVYKNRKFVFVNYGIFILLNASIKINI